MTKTDWWEEINRAIPGAVHSGFIDKAFRNVDGSEIELDLVHFDDRMAIREQLVAEVWGFADPC